ncbi:MAG: SDR family NAD(P)-dependent oxidoreductase, partial [SAR324 cluster bacterium]
MQGKVVVITGATSGIGRVGAEQLAGMGARLVLVARDKVRGETALHRLEQRGPGAAHRVHYADLSRIADMKRAAGEIAASEPRIDVLVNNAGALFGSRRLTADGLELTFATNHLFAFVLTHGLRDRLAAANTARVVNTSSHAHWRASRNLTDWQ